MGICASCSWHSCLPENGDRFRKRNGGTQAHHEGHRTALRRGLSEGLTDSDILELSEQLFEAVGFTKSPGSGCQQAEPNKRFLAWRRCEHSGKESPSG